MHDNLTDGEILSGPGRGLFVRVQKIARQELEIGPGLAPPAVSEARGKILGGKARGGRAKAKGRGLSDRSSDSQSDSHSACGQQSWLEVQVPPMSNITNHQVAGHRSRTERERCAVEVDNELMVLLNSIERCLRLF